MIVPAVLEEPTRGRGSRTPDRLHPDLIAGLGETRQVLGRGMNFSRTRAGKALHPAGDAVAPTAASHSPASLHRYDIDHSASYLQGRLIMATGAECRASDWDYPSSACQQRLARLPDSWLG